MSIAVSKIGAVTMISLKHAVVAEHIPALRETLKGCFHNGDSKIVINFGEVSHIDSQGLEFLMDIFEESKTKRGGVKLSKLNLICKDVFTATRLANLFEIYDEPEDAARSFL